MNIHFILVEPLYSENVGSVARAIKTMGFNNLILINPCDYLSKEAKWLAHGSIDILEKAKVFRTLEEALIEIDFIVATTSKKRKTNFNYHTPFQMNAILENKHESVQNIGLLFGREDIGLNNEQLKLADIISTVPLISSYPSINIAQTVMTYAYELSKSQMHLPEISNKSSEGKYKLLKERMREVMKTLGIPFDSNLHNRINERTSLVGEEDINLLLSFLNKINDKLKP